MKEFILAIFFFLFSILLHGQKSCNQIPFRAIHVMSNPSFENNSATCTSGYLDESGLVIPSWYTPTIEIRTAYFNACSRFMIPDSLFINDSKTDLFTVLFPVVPQPVPDGKGVIAVSDIAYGGEINTYPFHKSYASTCLQNILQKDSVYKLEFYVGFGIRDTGFLAGANGLLPPEFSPSPEKFGLFGSTACQGIVTQPIFGCPAVAGWTILGTCTVSGDPGTWVKADIEFTAPQNIQLIAIGPSCDTMNISSQDELRYNGTQFHTLGYSYFLDKLQFYMGIVAPPVVSIASGSLCNQDITLQMQPAGIYAGYNFQWFKNGSLLAGENNSTIALSSNLFGEGWYQCSVQNDSVCLVSDSFHVQWKSAPPSDALAQINTNACLGDTVMLNAYHDSSSTYLWQDGTTQPGLAITKSGTYKVTVSNECATVLSQKAINFQKCSNEVFVPNAFSPNGDGLNDLFKVSYFYPPSQFRMNIFNRLGQKVFSTSDPSKGWDGDLRGMSQPPGAYVWTISYKDHNNNSHSVKGTLVLVR